MQNDPSGLQDPLNTDEVYDFDPADQEYSLSEDEAIFLILRDLDYKAQLSAVHDLLQRQTNAERLLKDKIDEADAFARRTSGLLNYQAVEDWLAHLQTSTYQDAAHSMAAVGMLAPLLEVMDNQISRLVADLRGPASDAGHRSPCSRGRLRPRQSVRDFCPRGPANERVGGRASLVG